MKSGDPADLRFRNRPGRIVAAPRRASTAGWWWVVALVAAVAFLLVVRALLERTAWTAGPSPQPASSRVATPVAPAPAYAVMPEAVPMVYRCVDAAGHVSLQSQPCGPGQRTTKAIAAPPEVEPPRRALPSAARNVPQAQVTTWRGPSAEEQRRAAARVRCTTARAQREATLKAVGLRRTFDLLRQLDDAVARACKDV